MNVRYLILLTSIAFLGLSGSAAAHPCQPGEVPEEHKHCRGEVPDPDPEPTASYTVALTDGPFQFGPTPVFVNSKGNLNISEGDDLVITRPGVSGLDQEAWDDVFDTCVLDFDARPTSDITVGPNDWGVGTNSDSEIHINLKDIIVEDKDVYDNVLQRKEIQIHLRGIPNPLGKFLPVCGTNSGTNGGDWVESESFLLDYYTIWGKPWSGHGRAWDTCNHFDPIDPLSVIPEGTDPFLTSTLIISITCSP